MKILQGVGVGAEWFKKLFLVVPTILFHIIKCSMHMSITRPVLPFSSLRVPFPPLSPSIAWLSSLQCLSLTLSFSKYFQAHRHTALRSLQIRSVHFMWHSENVILCCSWYFMFKANFPTGEHAPSEQRLYFITFKIFPMESATDFLVWKTLKTMYYCWDRYIP